MPRDLVLSNGALFVAFDAQYALRELTWPHVGQENHSMGRRSRVGVQVDGTSRWLGGEGWKTELRYEPDTLIGRGTFASDESLLDVSVRDAVHPEHPFLLRRLEFRDRSGNDREITIWFHHDLDILESDAFNCVTWDPATQALLYHQRDRWFLAGCASDGTHGTSLHSCDDRSVKEGRGVGGKIEDLDPSDQNPVAIGAVDGAVGVTIVLPAHQSTSISAWVCAGQSEQEVALLQERILAVSVEQLLDEVTRAGKGLAVSLTPRLAGVDADLCRAAARSLQVARAHVDRSGAVSAANDSDTLSPGRESYAYTWPRDAAFVCAGLDRAGVHEPARRYLELCPRLLQPDGSFGHRYWPDGTPGSSWLPRIQEGAPTPPIQEDETALTLWMLGEHLRQRPDEIFRARMLEELVRPAADFLVRFRDPAHLPLPSWDLWEERFAIHTFTAASVVAGLRAASAVAEGLDEESHRTWTAAADQTDAAIETHLFHEDAGRYARCAHPQPDGYHLDVTTDASLCWLLLLGVREAEAPRLRATIEAVRAHLSVALGIARYENDPFLRSVDVGTPFPGNPWVLCTLALAECEVLLGQRQPAADRIRWVKERARPSGALPEQLHPETGSAIGTCPLAWSHASMLTAVLRLASS